MLNSRKTGFEAFYCQPGPEGAHEKGGIEGEIGRFRRRWFVPVPRAASLAALNARLAEADAAEDGRHIAGRAATVGEDFGVERGLLLPLPPEPFGTAAVLWPRVDRYARISVGKCRYSVPARLIGSRARVMLSANELRIFDGSKLAAVHPRLIAAGDEHLELDHYLEILVRKPGALPGSAALAQARAAGAFTSAHDAFWAAARARHGDAAGTRALIEVLLLHRRMPASQVIAGMTAALGAGSCSPDVVAVEARKHAAATPGPAAGPSWPAAQPRRSRADQPPVPGAFAGLGAAGRHGGLAEDGAQVLVAFLGLGASLAFAGLVVLRGAAAPGDQVRPGAEPGHVDTGFGHGVLGGAPCPAGHRLGLGQLLLVRGQQLFDHRGQVLDVGGQPVDAGQHLGQQDGVRRGEELRALQGLLQLADLAAGRGAGQLGQHLGVALAGDQVVHDGPASHPVQVGQDRGDLDRR